MNDINSKIKIKTKIISNLEVNEDINAFSVSFINKREKNILLKINIYFSSIYIYNKNIIFTLFVFSKILSQRRNLKKMLPVN